MTDAGNPMSAQVSVLPECAGELPEVMDSFEQEGFATAAPFAGNFSITAPREVFERVFGADLGAAVTELPVDRLPGELREKVRAVVFSRIDFGPVSY